jgi:hypothetical protein
MHSSAERSASFYEEYIMRNNKLLISALLLAAGTSLFPAVSMAQPGYCDGMGPMKEGRQGANQDRMKQRQAQLHQALKLNPDQEKAWGQFQESHPFMGNKMQRPDRAAMEKLTAPERADKMLERYLATITPAVAFLQGRDPSIGHRIAGRGISCPKARASLARCLC